MYFNVTSIFFSLQYLTILSLRKLPISYITYDLQELFCFQSCLRLQYLRFCDLLLPHQLLMPRLSPNAFLSRAVVQCIRANHPNRTNLYQFACTKFKLRNQTHIDISASIGCFHGYPTGIPSHQPHQSDSIVSSSTFNIS